jgi:TrmH family RNA methyltransferase
MPNSQITSLHSPHVERVKALLGSRGKKFRREEKQFIADGMQSVREALSPKIDSAPVVERLYVTDLGYSKLQEEIAPKVLDSVEIFPVTDEVMKAMADTESPQGILALCSYREMNLYKLAALNPTRLAYFWELQDPGNSGTVIRTGDACGFDGVIFSDKSVDIFSPKTVRATVGSLWHIPVVESVTLEDLFTFAKEHGFTTIAMAGEGSDSFLDLDLPEKALLIFGNEARGLPELSEVNLRVHIPMKGFSESLNVASAAAITMFHYGIAQNGQRISTGA